MSDLIPKCPNCGAAITAVSLTHVIFSCGSDRKKGEAALDNQSEKCNHPNKGTP